MTTSVALASNRQKRNPLVDASRRGGPHRDEKPMRGDEVSRGVATRSAASVKRRPDTARQGGDQPTGPGSRRLPGGRPVILRREPCRKPLATGGGIAGRWQ